MEELRESIEMQIRAQDLDRELRDMDARKARREELSAMLLLKLVETTGGRGQYDIQYNTRAAVEYTDALLAELEKAK